MKIDDTDLEIISRISNLEEEHSFYQLAKEITGSSNTKENKKWSSKIRQRLKKYNRNNLLNNTDEKGIELDNEKVIVKKDIEVDIPVKDGSNKFFAMTLDKLLFIEDENQLHIYGYENNKQT